mmetsp:Transcript_6020/g.12066  ORF Transcript_6020/g.12066 Transcript_6020/m.12066 type:complete len:323 (-) Transcript_6020:2113-3081(-)
MTYTLKFHLEDGRVKTVPFVEPLTYCDLNRVLADKGFAPESYIILENRGMSGIPQTLHAPISRIESNVGFQHYFHYHKALGLRELHFSIKKEPKSGEETPGTLARRVLQDIKKHCSSEAQNAPKITSNEGNFKALVNKRGVVLGQEMEEKLLWKAKILDEKLENIQKARTELLELAVKLGLIGERPSDDEPVTVNVRGQDITSAYKHWKKSALIDMVLLASRVENSKPFLDMDPEMVRNVIEYLSCDTLIDFVDWRKEDRKRHYMDYLGLPQPRSSVGNKKQRANSSPAAVNLRGAREPPVVRRSFHAVRAPYPLRRNAGTR